MPRATAALATVLALPAVFLQGCYYCYPDKCVRTTPAPPSTAVAIVTAYKWNEMQRHDTACMTMMRLLDPFESKRTYSSTENGLSKSQLSKLDSTKAWSPINRTIATDEWVQIDLETVRDVTGIQINKAADQSTEYVTQVQVDVSADGANWKNAFMSTVDLTYTSGKSYIDFPQSFRAKLVKIYVREFATGIAMRVGVHAMALDQEKDKELQAFDCDKQHPKAAQIWHFHNGQIMHSVPKGADLCVDMKKLPGRSGQKLEMKKCCPECPQQQFMYSSKYQAITTTDQALCLDVRRESNHSVQLWSCNFGQVNQNWDLTPLAADILLV